MSDTTTRADTCLQRQLEQASPYEVIALMYDGVLERLCQSQQVCQSGKHAEAQTFLDKAVKIIVYLRDSLDMTEGGEIAGNLASLYEYLEGRLTNVPVGDLLTRIDEACRIIGELKSGWDGIGNGIEKAETPTSVSKQ